MAKSDITDIASILIIGGVAYYVLSQPTALQKLVETFQNLFKGGGLPSPSSSSKEKSGGSTPVTGDTLWDSNRDGKWNNGKKRTVADTEGSQSPNGKGYHTAASGNPRLHVDGNGVAHLEADGGHGRIYVKATNFNSKLEFSFMFETATIDNISLKLRSRRNMGGSCENRFGGFGAHIDRTGGVGFKTESCRNNRENSIDGKAGGAFELNTWHTCAYSCYNSPDNKTVNFKMDIDGKTVATGKHPSPKPFMMDEASFMKESYFWLRINNGSTGKVAFKNVRLTKITTSGSKLAKKVANYGEKVPPTKKSYVMDHISCPFKQDDCTK